MALRCVSSLAQRVVGVVYGADEGQRMWLQRVISLSKNICIPTSVYYFFSQSPIIMEIFHNRLHLHHCRQCHSVVQVFSEEKIFFICC